MGFLDKFRKGLSRTSGRISDGMGRVFLGKKELDPDAFARLEEILVEADIGLSASTEILEGLSEQLSRRDLKEVSAVQHALAETVAEMVDVTPEYQLLEDPRRPLVMLVVGVNGVGKTTTIGKLGAQFTDSGRRVVFGAADTFRAAAVEQLAIWSERTGAQVVRHASGADPSAVAYDAVQAAVNRNADAVLIDTAGRLHTKDNLMEQLKKMQRVIQKVLPDAPHRVVLVLDGTNGQNAISQARTFVDSVDVTDLIVTKLDGTAKGGAIIPIIREFGIPVSYVGVGEQVDDLIPFQARAFADFLFSA